jgi:hypothetical protein
MLIDKILDVFTFLMIMTGVTVWIGVILGVAIYFMTEDHDGK